MSSSALHIGLRVAASLLGSYVFVWGFITLVIVTGVAAGAAYDQAQELSSLLAFLVFVGCFCWAYISPSLVRVWLVLAGGGAIMAALSRWIVPALS